MAEKSAAVLQPPAPTAEAFRTELLEILSDAALQNILREPVKAVVAQRLERHFPRKELLERLAAAQRYCNELSADYDRLKSRKSEFERGHFSEQVWRERGSYLITFLPHLPLKATREELSVVLGGVQLDMAPTGTFRLPSAAIIRVKRTQFETLPGEERKAILALGEQLAEQFRVEPHPVVQDLFRKP